MRDRNRLHLVQKKGVFYIQGTINGKRIRQSTRLRSREHAEAFRAKREKEELDRAIYGDRVATFSEAVLVYAEKGGEGRFLEPLIERWGNVRLSDITAHDVSRFARERYGALAPATVKRQLYTPLNAVMRAAAKAGLCGLRVFEAPKVVRHPVRYASEDWLRKFLTYANPRITAMVCFLTLTGARVSEACRLKLKDLDLEGGYATLWMGKTRRSRRVKLSPVVISHIEEVLGDGRELHPDLEVFGYADRWSVNQAIRRVCKRAGIEYLSSHKVGRHTFSARLLRLGASLKTVQEAGGWASMQIVAETYGHLESSLVDAAVEDAGIGFSQLVAVKRQTRPVLNQTGTHNLLNSLVGDSGIEPLTPTMSR